MQIFKILFSLLLVLSSTSCIKEDIINDAVPEEVRIITNTSTIREGDVIILKASYFNEVAQIETRTLTWETTNPAVLSVDNLTSNITGVAEGIATITVKVNGNNGELSDSRTITVLKAGEPIPEPTPSDGEKKGSLQKTSSYVSSGDFTIVETSSGIRIDVADNYRADTTLPGFAMFLTNNPNSLTNAYQVDAFDDADGAHYTGAFSFTVDGVGINDYRYLVHWCRPFTIQVGEALITDNE
ncbi:Ig-like domain-containing protein [Wenyingzhuangia aestuarii]|uniref:Ig-like domain-containing protein n=1 Tax=Wenyingzhuangia aestuarii TaxID=1647582 RepID=UPI00143B3D48|nr:Ig-like domain-containing protein [Wenyingzhuangia aestuarii]NJB83014.1 hypothetical protein [Wenyingzhuangia aestuarii]